MTDKLWPMAMGTGNGRGGVCGVLLVAVVGGWGCIGEPAEVDPVAGLYTPGSELGAEMDAAVRNPCDLLGEAGLEGVATSGTLSLEYTTRSLDGRYAPQNSAAVWIETLDGEYVATLELAASYRQPGRSTRAFGGWART